MYFQNKQGLGECYQIITQTLPFTKPYETQLSLTVVFEVLSLF